MTAATKKAELVEPAAQTVVVAQAAEATQPTAVVIKR
jgi:hypothetical protein